jgi:hypothetical protein
VESDWVAIDEIWRLLSEAASGLPEGLLTYVTASPLRATDSAYSCVVLVWDHDAWFINGWHTANAPIREAGEGLQMINYFEDGDWSKLPVPRNNRVESVNWDGTHFVFKTVSGFILSKPAQLKAAVMDSETGHGLSEEKIARNFGKLDGSIPLDQPMMN